MQKLCSFIFLLKDWSISIHGRPEANIQQIDSYRGSNMKLKISTKYVWLRFRKQEKISIEDILPSKVRFCKGKCIVSLQNFWIFLTFWEYQTLIIIWPPQHATKSSSQLNFIQTNQDSQPIRAQYSVTWPSTDQSEMSIADNLTWEAVVNHVWEEKINNNRKKAMTGAGSSRIMGSWFFVFLSLSSIT